MSRIMTAMLRVILTENEFQWAHQDVHGARRSVPHHKSGVGCVVSPPLPQGGGESYGEVLPQLDGCLIVVGLAAEPGPPACSA